MAVCSLLRLCASPPLNPIHLSLSTVELVVMFKQSVQRALNAIHITCPDFHTLQCSADSNDGVLVFYEM